MHPAVAKAVGNYGNVTGLFGDALRIGTNMNGDKRIFCKDFPGVVDGIDFVPVESLKSSASFIDSKIKYFWKKAILLLAEWQISLLKRFSYFFGRKNHSGKTKNKANTLKYQPTMGTSIMSKMSTVFDSFKVALAKG